MQSSASYERQAKEANERANEAEERLKNAREENRVLKVGHDGWMKSFTDAATHMASLRGDYERSTDERWTSAASSTTGATMSRRC